MSSNKNVIALPTQGDTQAWQCQVCKQELKYQQPINFREMLGLLGSFMEQHNHVELVPAAEQ